MLTARQRQILAFEEEWADRTGNREAAIRDTFGVSPARYFQELHRVIDDPGSAQVDPILVKRLSRIRSARRARRSLPFTAA